jgi:predicted DNA-binding transcriptional regulator
MKLNPIHKKIYEIIIDDLNRNPKSYSTITNTEISRSLAISPFSVRDHVILLVKRGFLQRINNYWTDDNVFHNRVLFKGKTIESN